MVSLVDIAYPQGFVKDPFKERRFFFAKLLVETTFGLSSSVPPRHIIHPFMYLPGTIPCPKTSFLKTLTQY